MGGATANLEKALDVDKETDLIQLSDTFEKTFESYTNRDILVKAAKENFATFDEATKEQLKNTSADEIASWGKYPETSDTGYHAKVGVLYLYTTLQQNKTNATLEDTKNAYKDLITKIENIQQDIPMERMETFGIKKIETDYSIPETTIAVNNETETTTGTDIEKPIINQNDKIVLGSVENPITIPILSETETIPEPTAKTKRQEKRTTRREERNQTKQENEETVSTENKETTITENEEIVSVEDIPADLQILSTMGTFTKYTNSDTYIFTPDQKYIGKKMGDYSRELNRQLNYDVRENYYRKYSINKTNNNVQKIEFTKRNKKTVNNSNENVLDTKKTAETKTQIHNLIEKDKLPDNLQKIDLSGVRTQQGENYIFTPADKGSTDELRNDNNKGLIKFEDQYEVDYFGKENNPSSPVDYIIFSPKKDVEETNTTKDPEAINTIEDPKWKNSKMFTVTGIDLSYTKTKAEENAKTRLANYLGVDRKTVAYRDTYEEDSTKSKTYQLSDGSYKRDLVIKFNKKEDLPT